MIVGEICYVVNVGDSRALLSSEGGRVVEPLSRDHKPSDPLERERIQSAGGQIYQTATTSAGNPEIGEKPEVIIGPIRVLPGRLSVSRTFGDVEAKLTETGGNPKVIIATPDIQKFKMGPEHDFVALGCDGIFDKLTNEDVSECVWRSACERRTNSVHQQTGLAAESVLKNAMYRKSLDNVTVVIIAFAGFKKRAFGDRADSRGARKRSSRSRGTRRDGSFNEAGSDRGNSGSRRVSSANHAKAPVRNSIQGPPSKRTAAVSKGEREGRHDPLSRNYAKTFVQSEGGSATVRGMVLGGHAGNGTTERRRKQELN